MEEEDKDGTLKTGGKPSTVQSLAAKPRPVPRPRNQLKGPGTTAQNGKPKITAPKPVLPPKPRRPPPSAPSEKPPDANEGVNINNNELTTNTRPSTKQRSVAVTSKNILSTSKILSAEITNSVEIKGVENGPENVDSDDEWYQPLRPRADSDATSSDDAYEDIPTMEQSKESQATGPR